MAARASSPRERAEATHGTIVPGAGSAALSAFDVLCLAVRPHPDIAALGRAFHDGIDFDALLRVASDHSVRPQLVRALAALGWDRAPPALRNDLDHFLRVHGAFCLAAAEQLGKIVDALAALGIRVAAFKGAALAASLHRDLTAREYNDIDLIVAPADVDQAEDVLQGFGYRSTQGDRRFRRAFLAHQRQYALVHDEQATVDLHWAFTAEYVPFPLGADEIWPALEEVTIGPHRVATIGGAGLALLLAGHGTKESWRSLGWVCDFALLVDRRRDLDWSQVHRRARERGCGDSVLLACVMAERLLDVAVPEALAPLAKASVRVDALASALVADLRRPAPEDEKRRNLADLDLCDGRWQRAMASVAIGLTPTVSDHHAMPLPSALWPLYRVTRPLRLGLRALGLAR
jgi:hypothetical protein